MLSNPDLIRSVQRLKESESQLTKLQSKTKKSDEVCRWTSNLFSVLIDSYLHDLALDYYNCGK